MSDPRTSPERRIVWRETGILEKRRTRDDRLVRSRPLEAGMKCPQCGGENCTEIVIHLREEETVQFFSCRRCEAKWWERQGETIALDQVLHLAAKKEK